MSIRSRSPQGVKVLMSDDGEGLFASGGSGSGTGGSNASEKVVPSCCCPDEIGLSTRAQTWPDEDGTLWRNKSY